MASLLLATYRDNIYRYRTHTLQSRTHSAVVDDAPCLKRTRAALRQQPARVGFRGYARNPCTPIRRGGLKLPSETRHRLLLMSTRQRSRRCSAPIARATTLPRRPSASSAARLISTPTANERRDGHPIRNSIPKRRNPDTATGTRLSGTVRNRPGHTKPRVGPTPTHADSRRRDGHRATTDR